MKTIINWQWKFLAFPKVAQMSEHFGPRVGSDDALSGCFLRTQASLFLFLRFADIDGKKEPTGTMGNVSKADDEEPPSIPDHGAKLAIESFPGLHTFQSLRLQVWQLNKQIETMSKQGLWKHPLTKMTLPTFSHYTRISREIYLEELVWLKKISAIQNEEVSKVSFAAL